MQLENAQITELAKPFVAMLDSIGEFYKDPQNIKRYREWHLKKYGRLPGEDGEI